MFTYVAYYKGKEIEVQGEEMTKLQAQQVAAKQFKAKRQWEVLVWLVEKDGEVIVHDGSEL